MAKCNQKGCEEEGTVDCYLPESYDKPDYQYCVEHAPVNGFCYCCGQFWAGVERFDFATALGGIEGLCENCDVEVKEAFDDEEEEDPYCYYGPD